MPNEVNSFRVDPVPNSPSFVSGPGAGGDSGQPRHYRQQGHERCSRYVGLEDKLMGDPGI
jgi:hypothetical protein